jgi:septal ring factor EnvC (AmiA/AmiB activator)
MSLYANAEALLREVGEQVRAGQPIAAAGASGGNPETGLYFEIRYRGRPLNPLAWVKTQ